MLLVYIPKGLSRYLIDHLPECLITYFSRKFELNAFEFKECLYSVSCSVCLISLSRFHCFTRSIEVLLYETSRVFCASDARMISSSVFQVSLYERYQVQFPLPRTLPI